MNICITGATGFIGSHLVSQLGADHRVIGFFKSGTPPLKNYPETVSFSKVDLSQAETIGSALSGFEKVDAVLHVAAYVHRLPKSKSEIESVFKINVDGTRHLLRSLRVPPKYFFFFSTVAVYGLEEGANIDESMKTAPVTPYGKSKLEAEEIVREWGEREGVTTIIYRLPLVYGAGNKGNMERLQKWINRGVCIMIGNGSNRRSLVHVGNIAEVTQKILNQPRFDSGVYHITDERDYTYKDLCLTIGTAMGKKVNVISIPTPVANWVAGFADMFHLPLVGSKTLKKLSSPLTFNSNRIQQALGFTPRFGIKDFADAR